MNLWTSPASDVPLDLPKVDQAELERIAERLRNDPDFQAKLKKRLAPYQTPVTWHTLMTAVP